MGLSNVVNKLDVPMFAYGDGQVAAHGAFLPRGTATVRSIRHTTACMAESPACRILSHTPLVPLLSRQGFVSPGDALP